MCALRSSRCKKPCEAQRECRNVWLQALHLFKKAEILLETMNKELDKNRVMANRTPRGGGTFIQRSSSASPLSVGPSTPGATLQPVSRVRHARWNRHMASMWMTAGSVDTGRFHSLRALHILGAPLPVAEEANHRSACLCCPCGAALLLLGRRGWAGPLPALPTHGSVSDLAATTAWTDRPSRASQSDIGSLPSVCSDLRNEFKDHTNEERQEAAAVLMLLVTAELQIEPPDPEAFRYILQTCCYFEVRTPSLVMLVGVTYNLWWHDSWFHDVPGSFCNHTWHTRQVSCLNCIFESAAKSLEIGLPVTACSIQQINQLTLLCRTLIMAAALAAAALCMVFPRSAGQL